MQARYDHVVFRCQNKAGCVYNYIGCHTNDLHIVSADAQEVLDSLMNAYKVASLDHLHYHLRCDYSLVTDRRKKFLCGGSFMHIRETFVKAE